VSAHRLFACAAIAVALASAGPARADDASECIAAAEHGQKLRRARELLEARSTFARCAQASCPAIVVRDCTQWLEQTTREIPTILPRAHASDGRDLVDVRVYVDEKLVAEQLDGRKLPLDPGAHYVRFEAAGRAPHEETVVLAESDAREVTVVLQPNAAPVATKETPRPPIQTQTSSGPPLGSWILGGVALVGVGGFAFFGATGSSDANDLRHGCSVTSSCTQSSVDAIKSKYVVADVSLGIAVVALAAAAVLWLTDAPAATTSATAR
jgi:hypothetical protein